MGKLGKSKPSCHTCAWRSASQVNDAGSSPVYSCREPNSGCFRRTVRAHQSCKLYECEELLAEVASDNVSRAQAVSSQVSPRPRSGRHTTSEIAPTVHVSEHAIFRYLERIVGVDMDEIRRKIATPWVTAKVKAGARIVKTDEATYLAAHNTIVTTLPPKDANGRREGKW